MEAHKRFSAWMEAVPDGRPSAPAADAPSTGPGVTPPAAPHVMPPDHRSDASASVSPAGPPDESSALQRLSDVVHTALGPRRLGWVRS